MKELSDSTFASVEAEELAVVDFWAPWCDACKRIAPAFEQLAREHEGVLFGTLDVEANSVVPAKYRVGALPTVVIFKHGEPVYRAIGTMSKDKLDRVIRSHLEGGDDSV